MKFIKYLQEKTSIELMKYEDMSPSEKLLSESIGSEIQNAISKLTTTQKVKLRKLTNNIINKAKKAGFTKLYVNLRSYAYDKLEICLYYSGNSTRELAFINTLEPSKEILVDITNKFVFDVTTGNYTGSWDENTISMEKYLEFIK
jgi:hypothetical protein